MFHLFICFVREGQLREQHHVMTSQAHAQNLQKSKLAEKEISLESSEKVLETRERKFDVFEKQLETREKHLEEREREVQRRTKEMNERDAKVRTQEEELNDGMRNYMEQERRYTSSLPSSPAPSSPHISTTSLLSPLPSSYPSHTIIQVRVHSRRGCARIGQTRATRAYHKRRGGCARGAARTTPCARKRSDGEGGEVQGSSEAGFWYPFYLPPTSSLLLLFSSPPLPLSCSPPLLLSSSFHLLFFFFDHQLLMPAEHKCYNRKRRK